MASDADISDSELARAACSGHRASFGALVKRHQRGMYRFLRMRTGSREDAEELLQDAFLRCWQNLERYDPERPFATWFYTLAARLAVSHDRRRKLPVATDREMDELAAVGDPAAILENREERENLWDLARRVLAPEVGATLWLFYGDARSAHEIGLILGKREEAIRAMLYRARHTLARHLQRASETSP